MTAAPLRSVRIDHVLPEVQRIGLSVRRHELGGRGQVLTIGDVDLVEHPVPRHGVNRVATAHRDGADHGGRRDAAGAHETSPQGGITHRGVVEALRPQQHAALGVDRVQVVRHAGYDHDLLRPFTGRRPTHDERRQERVHFSRQVVERDLPQQLDVPGVTSRHRPLLLLPRRTLGVAAVGQPVRRLARRCGVPMLQEDVPEFDLHGRAGVQLQAQQSIPRPALRVVVHQEARHVAVDELHDDVAARDDVNLVPVAVPDERLQHGRVAQRREQLQLAVCGDTHDLTRSREKAAAPLFIDLARVGVGRVDVRLIAPHHPAAGVGQERAAELNAAVAGGVGGADPVLQLQLEVLGRAASPDDECVRLEGPFGGGFAHDRLIGDAPERGIAVPARQRLTIEDRIKPGGVVRRHRPASGLAGARPLGARGGRLPRGSGRSRKQANNRCEPCDARRRSHGAACCAH